MIESISGKQAKNIIALSTKAKTRKQLGQFVVEGVRIISEVPVDKIVKLYFSKSFYDKIHNGEYSNTDESSREQSIFELSKSIEYELIADNVFEQLSSTMTPQGVIAILKMPEYEYVSILKGSKGKVLFLDELRDPGNLGTIIRTTEGAGFDMVILSNGCVDMFNPKVIRATMGAVYRVPFVYVEDIKVAIEEFVGNGYSTYAAYLDNSMDYAVVDYPNKSGIVIGNEANGIRGEVVEACTGKIKIPMCGNTESLNAAVAAAIIMYEVYRQDRVS